MTGKSRLFEILDQLVTAWCDRRELGPLSKLLPAYLAFSGLTDAWADLLEALRTVRGAHRDNLTSAELELLGEAIALTYQSLKSTGVTIE